MGLCFLGRWVVKGLARSELSISVLVVVVVGGSVLHLRCTRSGHRVVPGIAVAVVVKTGICACKSARVFCVWVSKRCYSTSGNSRSRCWHCCSSMAPISMLVGVGHFVCLLLLDVVAVVVCVTIVVAVVAL